MQVKISDNIILVGTAHISKDSVKEVKQAIEKYKELKPDLVITEKGLSGTTLYSYTEGLLVSFN